MLTINVAVLLAVIIWLRVRRTVQARSRGDQWFGVVLVVFFGVLIAPTEFGQGLLHAANQLVHGVSQASR